MCSFCSFINSHDLPSDKINFTPTQLTLGYKIRYELALFSHLDYKAKDKPRSARSILLYNVPMSYCPECGQKLITNETSQG